MWFSTVDLKSAYNCVMIAPADRPKTAFYSGDGTGCRQFKRLAMGLANAPSFFQRFMESILNKLVDASGRPFVRVFLDDLIIFSSTWEEHLQHVKQVLDTVMRAGLKIAASKCYWGQPAVLYLGHVVNGTGTRPTPKLCEAVQNFPIPETVKQV